MSVVSACVRAPGYLFKLLASEEVKKKKKQKNTGV
jgi:hypothetical protein